MYFHLNFILLITATTFSVEGSVDLSWGEDVLFTCCPSQSLLNVSNGECASPKYEFDSDLFPQTFVIPKELRDNSKSSSTLRLQQRPPWCDCHIVKNVSLRFKLKSEKTNEADEYDWALENSQEVSLKPSQLTLNSNPYDLEQFCINTIQQELSPSPTESHLFLEFVICKEKCLTPLTLSSFSIEEDENAAAASFSAASSKWDRISSCSDFIEENEHGNETISTCKGWVDFYHLDGKFFLIRRDENKTFGIQDESYPWDNVPPHSSCKDQGFQSTQGKLKFCLPDIKKMFGKYQELFCILSGLSGLFLLFNLSIYFALRESLSISGWTEFLYSLSLYCYFILSIVGLLIVPEHGPDGGTLCYVIAVLLQYFEFVNSATLMALSFDIFFTFCKFDTDGYTDDPKVSKLRLSLYLILTIFAPMLLVCLGVVQNLRPWDNHVIIGGIPQYSLFHCGSPSWLLSTYVRFGMQGLNLGLVLISAYVILNKRMRESRMMVIRGGGMEDEDEHLLDPDRIDIFSKLLIFSFLFWMMSFMEITFQENVFTNKAHLVGFHIVDYTQGVWAFFILICNRKTLRGLRNGDWSVKGLFQHACCTCRRNGRDGSGDIPQDQAPMSPLMKTMKGSSIRRSTVKGNAFY